MQFSCSTSLVTGTTAVLVQCHCRICVLQLCSPCAVPLQYQCNAITLPAQHQYNTSSASRRSAHVAWRPATSVLQTSPAAGRLPSLARAAHRHPMGLHNPLPIAAPAAAMPQFATSATISNSRLRDMRTSSLTVLSATTHMAAAEGRSESVFAQAGQLLPRRFPHSMGDAEAGMLRCQGGR